MSGQQSEKKPDIWASGQFNSWFITFALANPIKLFTAEIYKIS